MHWFDHFLTKWSKYLWIKTGDRHCHFVEPWFMDIPFCRMETVYHHHFVEQKARWSTATPPREWQRGWKMMGTYGKIWENTGEIIGKYDRIWENHL